MAHNWFIDEYFVCITEPKMYVMRKFVLIAFLAAGKQF